jgi:tetratricopeptide (TPR) repeat protein
MRAPFMLAVVVSVLCVSSLEAAEPAALAKARELYNAARYDAAIEAASAARREPGFADAAALVLARAQLERFRLGADPMDLAAARAILSAISPAALAPRDQVDLIIGMGQALYLAERFGAAAELFETALNRAAVLSPRDRLRLLDWWATALDREAQTRTTDRRAGLFEQIARRMETEMRDDPGSAVANYWLAVAARGEGDLDRAWDQATAAWVRATLAPGTADKLRADIDKFVTEALIPERARSRPPRDQPDAVADLRAQWDLFKQEWK